MDSTDARCREEKNVYVFLETQIIFLEEENQVEYRIERDTLGEMKVPADRLWGAQTQRSKENFPIGREHMPMEVVRALAILKKALLPVTIN